MAWYTQEYPVTRPFTLQHFTAIFVILGTVWVSIATVISVATVAYESTIVITNAYNQSSKVWYEKLFPNSDWVPESKVCDASLIELGDRFVLLNAA
jgi:hypothetical protein